MDDVIPAAVVLTCIGGAVLLEVVILLWMTTFSDGKRAGRNGRPYRNEKKREWLARAYDRGYWRGVYLLHQGDSDEDRISRNNERFGR